MVARDRIELPTLASSGRRSTRLSYLANKKPPDLSRDQGVRNLMLSSYETTPFPSSASIAAPHVKVSVVIIVTVVFIVLSSIFFLLFTTIRHLSRKFLFVKKYFFSHFFDGSESNRLDVSGALTFSHPFAFLIGPLVFGANTCHRPRRHQKTLIDRSGSPADFLYS